MKQLVFDTEIYRDYYLVMLKDIATGKTRAFEMYEGHPLDRVQLKLYLAEHEFVSFNGNHFDMPLLDYALRGATCEKIKAKCDEIIEGDKKPWEIELGPPECKSHIDLIEVAPGIASLKTYGGRMHMPKMQELPIDPASSISPEQREELKRYCENDLDTTAALYAELLPQIDLRRKMSEAYGIDLKSKSDAQIAEAVIKSKVSALAQETPRRPTIKPGTVYRYQPPAFIRFETDRLQELFARVCVAEFEVDDNGRPKCEELENLQVIVGDAVYTFGMGGLHSNEKSIAHFADDGYVLIDRDVASYYPNIVLNCELYPKHLGLHFLEVYGEIVRERLEAKRTGAKVKADALKICVNGSFGKLGSKWSILYSPDLLMQVTVTGQLALLMLIEAIEAREEMQVVSANTDGIVIKCRESAQAELVDIIGLWEFWTGFETEETRYAALYSRDVNSYIALKTDGSVKQKGACAFTGTKGMRIEKNPANRISTEAVIAHLREGASIERKIRGCDDITKFVTVRNVTGGAVKNDRYLGRVVRWYYGRGEQGAIQYKKSGNQVARSQGAVPCMDMGAFPDDVDYDWYILEAKSILKSIGVKS